MWIPFVVLGKRGRIGIGSRPSQGATAGGTLVEKVETDQYGKTPMSHARLQRLAALALLLVCLSVSAQISTRPLVPEPGIYRDGSQAGNGYLFESQGDVWTFAVFAYDEQGRPEHYVASGRVSQGLSGVLYKTSGGRMLGDDRANGDGAGLQRERLGTISLYSHLEYSDQFYDGLFVDVTLDSPRAGQQRNSFYALSRMNYGRGAIRGSDSIQCWPDFRGDWVFVDKTDASRVVWRYSFTEVSSSPPLPFACGTQRVPHIMSFRDPVAGATLRCIDGENQPPGGGPPTFSGCELRRDGSDAVVFSFFRWDMGVERMIGATQSLAVAGGLPVRNVLAIRVD